MENEYKVTTDRKGKYYIFERIQKLLEPTKYGEWRKVSDITIKCSTEGKISIYDGNEFTTIVDAKLVMGLTEEYRSKQRLIENGAKAKKYYDIKE